MQFSASDKNQSCASTEVLSAAENQYYPKQCLSCDHAILQCRALLLCTHSTETLLCTHSSDTMIVQIGCSEQEKVLRTFLQTKKPEAKSE